MAVTTQILREDQNRATILHTGSAAFDDRILDVSTLSGATGLAPFYTQLEHVEWSFPSDAPGIFGWEATVGSTGATGIQLLSLNGSGNFNFKKQFMSNVASTFGATGVRTGNIRLRYTGSGFWTIVYTLLKSPLSFRRYFSTEN